jgi:hypothetical protein
MSQSMKATVLLCKTEVTKGLDSVPTPAANAILVRASTPKLLTAQFVERNNLRGYKGNFGKLVAGVHRTMDIEVELAGAGAAGTAPKWGPLLLACGFSETLLAVTSATYALTQDIDSTVTIYCYLDKILFKMTGCIGTPSWNITSGGIPVVKMTFMGEYSPVTDVVARPTGMVFTGFQKPLTVSKLNTPIFTFHGLAAVVKALTFDLANQNAWRDLINSSGAVSPDRKPAGNVTMELPTVATLDVGERTRLGTPGAMQLVHGTVPGNIVQMDWPVVQITGEPSISDDQGVAMVAVAYEAQPNTGNDEFVLVVK